MTFYLAGQLTCPSTLSRVHFVHLLFNICQFLLRGHTFCKNPPITDLMTSLQKHTLIIAQHRLYTRPPHHLTIPVINLTSFYHLNQSSVHPHHLSHPHSHRLIHRCSNRFSHLHQNLNHRHPPNRKTWVNTASSGGE